MDTTIKSHLKSAIVTFVSAVLVTLATQLSAGIPIEWTTTGLFSLLLVAGRAGVKALFEAKLI